MRSLPFWSLQHVKRAALQHFNASSAEVICEVGKDSFLQIVVVIPKTSAPLYMFDVMSVSML